MSALYAAVSSSSSSGSFDLIVLVAFALVVCYLVAWVLSMLIVTKAAEEKGYPDIKGQLWFIGLFGLIFTPGIIVAALPDKKLQKGLNKDVAKESIEEDLPRI